MNLFLVRSKLFAAFICLLALASCNNYGKKVIFPGNKGEVYYKGDGVSEADATATGKFLEEQEYFAKDDKKRSIQISKDSGHIKARFVVDIKALATIPNADNNFALIGALMSKEVFNSTPVDIIYTDEFFKDIRTIPYKSTAVAQVDIYEQTKQMQKKNYDKNTLYYSKGISNENADTIFSYLVKSGFFVTGGNNDLLLLKEGSNGFHFRFPVKASFANGEGLQKVDNFAKDLKRDLFTSVPLEFEVLDENMVSLKTFTY